MKITASRQGGFTLVEIMIVVAIIGVLASVAMPYYAKARANSQKNSCINTLRQMDGGVQEYAIENKLPSSASYALDDIKPYLRLTTGGGIPPCPAGGAYEAGACVTNPPTCSLSDTDGHAYP